MTLGPVPFDTLQGGHYTFQAVDRSSQGIQGSAQANVATQETAPDASARIFGAHAHTGWPQSNQQASLQGPASARGLTAGAVDGIRSMADQTYRQEQRIRRRSDFEALRKRGISSAHPLLLLRAAPNSFPHARFGFIVSKRVAAKAVDRNRVRRRLREIARRTPVRPGWDLLFIARRAAVDADFASLERAVHEVERRTGLLGQSGGQVGGN